MTIPTRDEALKALDKLSSDYDLAGGWSPDPMPLLATLRSYIESHTREPVCPRSANGRPESFTVRDCVAAGECGCGESVTPGSTVRASPVQPVKLEWQPIALLPSKGDVLVGCWSENIDGSYSWEFVELVRLEAKGHDDTVLNINSSNFTHIIKHSTHWRYAGSAALSKGITE